MAKTAKFSLKLLIDEEKNKVVLAEADQDFVDVLFSLLTLPMGTIVKLLEKHQKLPQVLGCYLNLNRSVADLAIENFATEACKTMLLYPKSTKEIHCRRLKLNLDDTEPSKFFVCPYFYQNDYSCHRYSNFNTSKCGNGHSMTKQVEVPEELQAGCVIGNDVDGVFVSCRSLFIVTDDLRVTLNSIGAVVNVLKDLGYQGYSDMREIILEVGFDEVVVILGCLFTTNAAFTYAFLRKDNMAWRDTTLYQPVQAIRHALSPPVRVFHVNVFVRKLDRKVLYAESSVDFINSLLTFLVLPLELAWSLSDDSNILECVRNLCRSEGRRALVPKLFELPGYYACRNSLLEVHTSPLSIYQCLIPKGCHSDSVFKFTRPSIVVRGRRWLPQDNVIVDPIDQKSTDGFLRRGTKYIVSDDLSITAMSSLSAIGLLKKNQVDINDMEEHAISISFQCGLCSFGSLTCFLLQLISILRASLTSSSALTNGLSYLLVKKPKEET